MEKHSRLMNWEGEYEGGESKISAEKYEPFQLLRRIGVTTALKRSFAVAHNDHRSLGESWSMAERGEFWS